MDNYDEAIERLQSVLVLLNGGYYEPKSERDVLLAQRLDSFLFDELTRPEGM